MNIDEIIKDKEYICKLPNPKGVKDYFYVIKADAIFEQRSEVKGFVVKRGNTLWEVPPYAQHLSFKHTHIIAEYNNEYISEIKPKYPEEFL
jgi:hypothetical protein